jgi:hypothetical protein
MRWAEWILRQILASTRPGPKRTLRLAILPLEDRAVPHNGIDHGQEPHPEPEPPTEVIVKETPPTPPAPADHSHTADVPPDEIITGETVTTDVIKPDPGTPEDELIFATGFVPEDVRRDVDEEATEVELDDVLEETPPAEHDHDDEMPIHTMTLTPTAQPKAPFPQIGDRVWKDLNGNGHQDAGEPGLPFIAIKLYQGDTLVGQTTTNGLGEFAFNRWNVTNGTADTADDGLKANTAYQLRIAGDQPGLTGLRPTATNQGSGNADELRDSDAQATTAGAVLDLTLGIDELYSHYDVGYAEAATLGNLVWHDANNNGIKDKAELGIPGVTVRLLDADNLSVVSTTTTGADGSYLFTGLLPGTYVVEVAASNFAAGAALAGTASSTGRPGQLGGPVEGLGTPVPDAEQTDGKDNGTLVGAAVRCKPVTVGGAQMENKAVDFGFFHAATINGKVFLDQNANGRIDPEDTTGLAGISVRVAGPAGTFTTKTDDTGAYTFGALPAGAYTVTQVNQPIGYKNSTPNLATVSVAGAGAATVHFGEARAVDLRLTGKANKRVVPAGGFFTLTYRVKNLGTLDATGVMLLAPLPKAFKYVGSELTGSVTYDSVSQRATIGTLAAGAEVVIKIRVQSTVPGAKRLRATVQGQELEDAVGNNAASLVITTTRAGVRPQAAGGSSWLLARG